MHQVIGTPKSADTVEELVAKTFESALIQRPRRLFQNMSTEWYITIQYKNLSCVNRSRDCSIQYLSSVAVISMRWNGFFSKLPRLLRGCGLLHCGSLCFSASHICQRINKACNVYIPCNKLYQRTYYAIYIYIYNIYIQFTGTDHFSIISLVKLSWFTNLYVHFATQTHRFTVIEWRSKDPKCHRPSVEKGGSPPVLAHSMAAIIWIYPPAVTVARFIEIPSDFFLNILVVTVYRVVDPSDPFGYGWTENKCQNWTTSLH